MQTQLPPDICTKNVQISRDFSIEIMLELHCCTALADAIDAQIERYRDTTYESQGCSDQWGKLACVTYILSELMDRLSKLNTRVDNAAIAGFCHV